MKKGLLLVAAIFAAFTLNAKVYNIDLNSGVAYSSTGEAAGSVSVASGVMTINWTASAAWQNHGVKFALNNISQVTEIAFEYKGDGVPDYAPDGVALYPYLRDDQGARWYKSSYWPNVQETDWQTEAILPDNSPWDGATYNFGDHPFTSLEFIVDASKAGSGVFYLRNIKITTNEPTDINNVATQSNSVKVMRDGQMYILRDGKTYNALGAEVK